MIRFALLSTILTVASCDDTVSPLASIQNTNRPIATIYKVKAKDDVESVQCFRIRDTELTQVTVLSIGEFVDIAAIEDGLRRFDGNLWRRIYPRLSHRPSCYVNIDNLIPFS